MTGGGVHVAVKKKYLTGRGKSAIIGKVRENDPTKQGCSETHTEANDYEGQIFFKPAF